MKKTMFAINFILLATFLTSCGNYAGVHSLNSESVQKVSEKDDINLLDMKSYTSYGDQLKEILFKEDDIIIFSPESFKIAMDFYSNILTEEDRNSLKKALGNIDYLSYEDNDTFQIVNRLWVNDTKDFYVENISNERVKDAIYLIDMSDSKTATYEKNEFVNDATHGLISSTPSVFDDTVNVDAMNILYFKDTWQRGEKIVDEEKSVFHNLDGSEGSALMFHDYGNTFFYDKTAHMCEMTYNDGFSFMVILPDEGYSVKDIDIDSFIYKKVEYSNDGWTISIPEFEAESVFDLGNVKGEIDPFIMPLNNGITNVSQVAKLTFDHTGTEAGAVTEAIVVTSSLVIPKNEPYEFVCDRPFIFCVIDTLNEDVAFMGIVKAFH